MVPAAGATSGTVSCSWASIASAAQQTATFVVRPLTSSAGGTIDNTVTIATTTVENTPANNSFRSARRWRRRRSTSWSTRSTASIRSRSGKAPSNGHRHERRPVACNERRARRHVPHRIAECDVQLSGRARARAVRRRQLRRARAWRDLGHADLHVPGPGLGCVGDRDLYDARRDDRAGLSGTTFNAARRDRRRAGNAPREQRTVHATTARRTADLAVVKSAPASFTPGVPFAWTIAISNNGPNDSSGAIVTDTLPAGVTFVSASAGCGFAAGTVTCTLGALPGGSTAMLSIDVMPSSPYTGANPLRTPRSVAAVNEIDPVTGNNSGSASTVPGASVTDLSLVKSGPASVLPGAPISWQLVIATRDRVRRTGRPSATRFRPVSAA